jgi:hypothetical protein
MPLLLGASVLINEDTPSAIPNPSSSLIETACAPVTAAAHTHTRSKDAIL